jgi:hypothetical protein
MTQTMLRGFTQEEEFFTWDYEYQDYSREEDSSWYEEYNDIPEGYIECHVVIELYEALVKVRDKNHKIVARPGYKLIVAQSVAYPDRAWETFLIHDEEYPGKKFKTAIDDFMNHILTVQDWITTAESRAKLIPEKKDVFECMHCGWVTDKCKDDIVCHGCGKRYWSEKLMRGHWED